MEHPQQQEEYPQQQQQHEQQQAKQQQQAACAQQGEEQMEKVMKYTFDVGCTDLIEPAGEWEQWGAQLDTALKTLVARALREGVSMAFLEQRVGQRVSGTIAELRGRSDAELNELLMRAQLALELRWLREDAAQDRVDEVLP